MIAVLSSAVRDKCLWRSDVHGGALKTETAERVREGASERARDRETERASEWSAYEGKKHRGNWYQHCAGHSLSAGNFVSWETCVWRSDRRAKKALWGNALTA